MQALRALVRLEAEVEAVQVRAKLVPVPWKRSGSPPTEETLKFWWRCA